MLRPGILLSAVLGLTSFCAGQAVYEPRFEGPLAVPVYEGGYVLDWDAPTYSKVTLYRPDAKPVYSLSNRGSNGALYNIWTADRDGAAARAYHDRRRQGQIDLLDISGKVERTINTGSYVPTHITFGPDHSIWAVGVVHGYDLRHDDFNVVRHYSRTGKELGEALPWSQIAGGHNAYTALQLVVGGRRLFSASDRIGFISEANSGNAKWIEMGFAGNLLGQYDLGPYNGLYFVPSAMTSSGYTYAKIYERHRFKGYAILDRSPGNWRKIAGYPTGTLIGANGDSLVFSQIDGGSTVLRKLATAAIIVKKRETVIADASQHN